MAEGEEVVIKRGSEERGRRRTIRGEGRGMQTVVRVWFRVREPIQSLQSIKSIIISFIFTAPSEHSYNVYKLKMKN